MLASARSRRLTLLRSQPESDDDDFLNEVVDFGDGKKYTISASPQEPSFAADILDQREKLMAAENAKHGSASGGRGDYDRSRPAPSSSKPQLFNERSNRLEPKDSAGGLPKGRRLSNDPAPARGPPSSTPAPQPTKPAWGIVRDANGKIVPSLPPSRALPPHLAAAAAMAAAGITPTPAAPAAAGPIPPAAAARSSAVPPRSGGLGSVRPTGGLGEKRSSLSAPRGSLVEPRGALTKPTTSPRPSAAQPVVPPTGPAADRRASHDGPRPAAPAAPVAAAPAATPAAVAAPTPVIEDITELQKDEMHTAAERARLRRQKEEEERAAAQERARQKAKELEAKFGPAPSKLAAVQAKAAPKETARKPAKAGSAAAAGGPAPLTGPRAGVKGANAPPLPKIPVPAVAVPAPSASRQQQQPSPPAPAPASAPTPAQPTLAAAPPTLAQLIEGQEAGAESQDVDFANLGDLLAAESSPTPAAAQPTASRRPAAADFFDVPPSGSSSGPVLPPPAPSRSETAWRRSSAGEKQPAAAVESVSAPSTSPQATKATASGSPDAQKSKAPQAPAAVEDVMQRIKGAMLPGAPSAVDQAQAEAESPFTYLPRPPSPSPVWKKYAVKLNRDGRQRSPIPANQLTVDPKRETLRAFDALSWTPSMYKWLSLSTLSRDDWLLAPPFRKVLGRIAPKPAPVVSLPTQRISDLPVNPPPESPVFQKAVVKLPAAPVLEVIPPTPARGSAAAASQFSRSAQEATWRRAPQVGVNDPSAAVGGPIKPLIDAGSSSNVRFVSSCNLRGPITDVSLSLLCAPLQALFAAPLGPETTGAPIIRLRTPPGSKSSSSPKLPQGSSIGFYRDRTPSIGTASDEQMASLVRFTVSSELMDGPGGGDPVYEEDGPSFPSLNRPSSTAGGVGVMSAQDEVSVLPSLPSPEPSRWPVADAWLVFKAFELNARATAAASALSPPSAATSDAWSKTPMAYSPADRPALPGLYGAQSGVPSHSPWAAAPSYDAQYSPKLSHHSPQYQQPQHHHQQQHLGNNGLRGQYNPYAQPQQQQRYASPAHGYALPTSSPHPPAGGGGGAIYSSGSTMNGNAPRFQPSGQQHPSTRPDPSARPFVPGGAGGGGHHPGLHRNASSDMGGSGPYGGAGAGGPGSSPIGGSPYSPGISLPGLPPAVQGGVWVPISMPRDGAYGSSPSLASAALPTPYYTPQPYQQQQQQQRSVPGLGNQQQQQQQQRFRNLSEFSTSSPVFTPQQQQQQRGAFGGGGGAGGSPFEVRPQAATQAVAAAAQAASAGQDDKDLPAASASAYFPSVRAPVFTPTGGAGVGNFGKW